MKIGHGAVISKQADPVRSEESPGGFGDALAGSFVIASMR